jgi:hypothetical protein
LATEIGDVIIAAIMLDELELTQVSKKLGFPGILEFMDLNFW